MAPEQLRRFLLYKRFFHTLIADIRNELKAQVDKSFLARLRERMTGTAAEVFSGLDAIIARIDTPQYEIIDGFIAVTKRTAANETGSIQASASAAHPTWA